MLFFYGGIMLEVILVLVLMAVSFFFGAFVTFLGTTAMCRTYAKEVCVKMLLILYSIEEDVQQIRTEKYSNMKDAGISPNDIMGQMNVDDYEFDKWRNMVVTDIVTRYPFRRDLNFRDYNGAMKFLNEYFSDITEIPKTKPKTKFNKKI